MTDYTNTPAYLDGYADGKSKAHFEVRYAISDHDFARCECDPCITRRQVVRQWMMQNIPPDDLEPETAADIIDRFISGAYTESDAVAALVAV